MQIERMPFCCTSAIIGSFGEHGEPSIVTVEEVKRLVSTMQCAKFDEDGHLADNPKLCFFAISVDPQNVKILKQAGFKEVDAYRGIQGKVHILTFHAEP